MRVVYARYASPVRAAGVKTTRSRGSKSARVAESSSQALVKGQDAGLGGLLGLLGGGGSIGGGESISRVGSSLVVLGNALAGFGDALAALQRGEGFRGEESRARVDEEDESGEEED